MNRLHVDRKQFLIPLNEESKHEGENRLIKAEHTPNKILKIALDNCLPLLSFHQGLFPEFSQRIADDLPPPPRIDKYRLARFLTEKAIREKRIFTICGPYPVIRAALRKRGWVEKKPVQKHEGHDHKEDGNDTVCDNAGKNDLRTSLLRDEDSLGTNTNDIHEIMSRLVRNEDATFYWTIKKDAVDYYNLHTDQIINHYARTGSFTTKIGLCLHLRNLPWYVSANPNAFFPRCYGICMDDEKADFIEDFRKTAASSIVKWVVNWHMSGDGHRRSWAGPKEHLQLGLVKKEDAAGIQDLDSDEGKKVKELPGGLIEMACKVCEIYIAQLEHADIDTELGIPSLFSEEQWQQFIDQYYALIHDGAVILNADRYYAQCQTILQKILLANPQHDIDGIHNIWIIKPGAKSRGREIVCKNRLEDILKIVEPTDQFPIKDHKWVVQKYIESPLLIYDTKFDIRQWFLVTDWNPLTVWFYKESYLRFSTQRFSLDNLHSSIHLCNNSIQKNYKNAKDRSSQLPYHNMWTSSKFQEYLQKKGLSHVWHNIIYPTMKKILIYTMKMAQDQTEPRRNSFELFGADFILGNDFKPWLIEINTSPTMYPSTPITSDLCAQVQEDTIKVVIDRKIDKNSDIGHFELLWRQQMMDLPPFNPTDLFVEGVGVKRLKKHVVSVSNFNFLEPLMDAIQSANDEKSKGDFAKTVSDKQVVKGKQGNSSSCTLPKTLKKQPEKNAKPKLTQKKPTKVIDFPRLITAPETKAVSDKKKTPAIKDKNVQKVGQAASTTAKSPAIDWALLQPSKGSVQCQLMKEGADIQIQKSHEAERKRGKSGQHLLLPRPKKCATPPSRQRRQSVDKKTPCLICGDGFQSSKSCKRCSSFCATVLQGGSYLPMSPCSSAEKMTKDKLGFPNYSRTKYL